MIDSYTSILKEIGILILQRVSEFYQVRNGMEHSSGPVWFGYSAREAYKLGFSLFVCKGDNPYRSTQNETKNTPGVPGATKGGFNLGVIIVSP